MGILKGLERIIGGSAEEGLRFVPGRLKFSSPEDLPAISTPEEKILASNEANKTKRLLGGNIGEATFVEIKDDGCGVFKPHGSYSEIERIGYISRERAAFLIDLFLGFDLIPPTVIKKIEKRGGSLQKFIESARTWDELSREDRAAMPTVDTMKLCALDYILNNTDRHSNNFLVRDNKIYAIDHGHTFSKDDRPGPRTGTIRDMKAWGAITSTTRIPEDVKDKIYQFSKDVSKQNVLRKLLLELLPEGRVEEVFIRIRALQEVMEKYGVFNEESMNHLANAR